MPVTVLQEKIKALKAENKELKSQIKSLKKEISSYEKEKAKILAKTQKDEEKKTNREKHKFTKHKFLDSFSRMYLVVGDINIKNTEIMLVLVKYVKIIQKMIKN